VEWLEVGGLEVRELEVEAGGLEVGELWLKVEWLEVEVGRFEVVMIGSATDMGAEWRTGTLEPDDDTVCITCRAIVFDCSGRSSSIGELLGSRVTELAFQCSPSEEGEEVEEKEEEKGGDALVLAVPKVQSSEQYIL